MRKWPGGLAFIFLAVLLVACGQKPLTEQECRIVLEKEIEYATLAMSAAGEESDSFANWVRDGLDEKVEKCVTDRATSRKYYKCMVGATGLAEMQICMGDENSR